MIEVLGFLTVCFTVRHIIVCRAKFYVLEKVRN